MRLFEANNCSTVITLHLESDGDDDEAEDVSFEDAHNYENQLASEDDEIENLMMLDAILDEEVNSVEKKISGYV